MESWSQWPSTCCASPEGVLNLDGQAPMQGMDLGLCTGDALCYAKDYMSTGKTPHLHKIYHIEGAWSVKVFVTNGTKLIVY